MLVLNGRDLGQLVRQRRQDLKMSQSDLASSARVSRRWLSDLESGKPTAEIGLVLRAVYALGLEVDIRPVTRSPHLVDLDELLRNIGGDDA